MIDPSPCSDHPDGLRLALRVSPRASRSGVGPIREGLLVVSVTSPPVDGEANAAVVKVLSKWLGVPSRSITLVQGERGRQKVVAIAGMSRVALEAKLLAL